MATFDVMDLSALEILDSRGRPTLAVTVWLADGTAARAGVGDPPYLIKWMFGNSDKSPIQPARPFTPSNSTPVGPGSGRDS